MGRRIMRRRRRWRRRRRRRNIPNFSLQEWKYIKMKMVEEYCWVIRQMAAQSCCSQSGSSVLKFRFQLVDNKYTEF